MASIISVREGPLAVFGESDGKSYVMVGENTLEAKRQANRAWDAAEATGALVEGLEGATNLIETALQPGAAVSTLTETQTAKIMTAAERDRVQGIAASKRQGVQVAGRALAFLGRRNRVLGGISADGMMFDFAENVIERIAGATRLRSARATKGIDVNDDGTVQLPGQKVSEYVSTTLARATMGKRRRLIERLSTSSYRVFGFTARSSGAVEFSGLTGYGDGRLVVGGEKRRPTLDGTVVRYVLSPRRRPIELLSTVTGWRMFGMRARPDGSVQLPGFTASAVGQVISNAFTSNPDGSLILAGERRRASADATTIRATVGARRRVIEKLTRTGYMVHGLRIQRSGANLDLLMDNQRVVRVSAGGAPQISGVTGGLTISTGDTYARDGGVFPVLTNMKAWALWGSSSAFFWGDNFQALAARHGSSAYAGGKGSERVEHHAARYGSRPALLTFPGNVIPGAVAPIEIPKPSNWTNTAPLLPYAVIVNGVPGTLAPAASEGVLIWTRATAGADVAVTADVPAVSVLGRDNRANFTVINFGKNSLTSNSMPVADVLQITIDAYLWAAPFVKRFLLVNHFVDGDSAPGGGIYTRILDYNAQLAAYFGRQLIDQYGFVCLGKPIGQLLNCPITDPAVTGRTIWDVTGIVPTQADLDQQTLGRKPDGLLSRDPQHGSELCDEAVAYLIEQWAIGLGQLTKAE